MISVVAFDFREKREESITPGGVAAAADRFCWVDAESAGPEELAQVFADLGFPEEFARGAPRTEGVYDDTPGGLRLTFNEVTRGPAGLTVAPVVVLIGDRGIVTVHAGASACVRRVRETYREDFARHSLSHGFLVFEIADRLVEGYREALLAVGGEVERLQLELFGPVDDAIFHRVADLTRQILLFRRTLLRGRELLHELATRRSRFIPDTTQPSLELLAGAADRLVGDLATERDAITDTLNLYMGMVGHRTSHRLKRLTTISVIFLPLTFLCGVYGMNFVEFPEVHWRYGYLFFWIAVLSIAGTILWLMKRHRWL
jgi:magnesium transporter